MYYLFFYFSPSFYAYEHLPVHMFVCAVPKGSRRGCQIPLGLELQMMIELPYWYGGLRLGPLEEKPVILSTELSL